MVRMSAMTSTAAVRTLATRSGWMTAAGAGWAAAALLPPSTDSTAKSISFSRTTPIRAMTLLPTAWTRLSTASDRLQLAGVRALCRQDDRRRELEQQQGLHISE